MKINYKPISKLAAVSLCAATLMGVATPLVNSNNQTVYAATKKSTKKSTAKKSTAKKSTSSKSSSAKKSTSKKSTSKTTTKKSTPAKKTTTTKKSTTSPTTSTVKLDTNNYLDENNKKTNILTATANGQTTIVAESFGTPKTLKMTHNSYEYDANGKPIKSNNKNLDAGAKHNSKVTVVGYRYINGEPYYAVKTDNLKNTSGKKLNSSADTVFMKAANFNGDINDIAQVIVNDSQVESANEAKVDAAKKLTISNPNQTSLTVNNTATVKVPNTSSQSVKEQAASTAVAKKTDNSNLKSTAKTSTSKKSTSNATTKKSTPAKTSKATSSKTTAKKSTPAKKTTTAKKSTTTKNNASKTAHTVTKTTTGKNAPGATGSANMRGGVVKVSQKQKKADENAILKPISAASAATSVKVISNTVNNAKVQTNNQNDKNAKYTAKKDLPIYEPVKTNDGQTKMVNVTQTAQTLQSTNVAPTITKTTPNTVTTVTANKAVSPTTTTTKTSTTGPVKAAQTTVTTKTTKTPTTTPLAKNVSTTDAKKVTNVVSSYANAKTPSVSKLNSALIQQNIPFSSSITRTNNAGTLQEVDGSFIFTPNADAPESDVTKLQSKIRTINKRNTLRVDLRNELTENKIDTNTYNKEIESLNDAYEQDRDDIYNSFNALSNKTTKTASVVVAKAASVIAPTSETKTTQAQTAAPSATLTSTGKVTSQNAATASLTNPDNYGVTNVGSQIKAGTKIDTKNIVATYGGLYYKLTINGQTVYVPFVNGLFGVK